MEMTPQVPGIVDFIASPGLSIAGFPAVNEGIVFFWPVLVFEQRTDASMSKGRFLARSMARFRKSRALVAVPGCRHPSMALGTPVSKFRHRTGSVESVLWLGQRWAGVWQPQPTSVHALLRATTSTCRSSANVDRTRAKADGH
jgi:multidrug efflux pump